MPKRVLIVEDEALLRRTLTTALREAGYRTIPVGSAEEAEPHLFPEPAADLVLLDNRLPKASGVSVLERLREQRAKCSVILMTAYDQPEVRRAADQLASGYVLKPFDLEDMVRGVTSLLGGPLRRQRWRAAEPSGRTDRASGGDSQPAGGETNMAARRRKAAKKAVRKATRRKATRKAARRKVARKAGRRKVARKAGRRKTARKAVRRKTARKAVRRKTARKAARRKVARKRVRRKVARKAVRRKVARKAVRRKVARKAVRRKVARAMLMGMAMDEMGAGAKRK